ncbi:unnamed protein product [Toxocara canis]|uniref:Peptidase A1 domain-containing protein n=1 Tax=Toxocara canis TaxID=6265 RepID=A0A183V9U1_TOXCA|nr:unnamed protein product [Toxocara canis]
MTLDILTGGDLMWGSLELQPITELTPQILLAPTNSFVGHEVLHLDQYWGLESIGVFDPSNQKDDDKAL